MRTLRPPCIAVVAALLPGVSTLIAADFKQAVVVLAGAPTTPQKKAAQMLTEEIEKRTQLRLKVSGTTPVGTPAIYLGLASAVREFAPSIPEGGKPESFTLVSTDKTVVVAGADDRGVVFGAGYLLRQFHMARQKLELDANLQITSAPTYAVRGHQLGYRPKTNAYDAWSVPMWEQYIRELAIFGNNTIELIPPRSDDDDDSPHFPLPKIEMMVEMSRIADEYGLDVSVWYPAMDQDYSDPATGGVRLEGMGRGVPQAAAHRRGLRSGRRSGAYAAEISVCAARKTDREPAPLSSASAQMWVSPQGFTKEWRDEFWRLVADHPGWLSGLVYGPQVYGSLEEFRAQAPKRFPIRFYPDITHSIHAEFPVPDWDLAYATTEGRETINPRPVDEAAIFHRYQHFADGMVSYSEGCNDDVNKFVWSGLLWNPEASPKSILTEYSRFFIGDDMADSFAGRLVRAGTELARTAGLQPASRCDARAVSGYGTARDAATEAQLAIPGSAVSRVLRRLYS